MRCENARTAEDLIRDIQELECFFEELTHSIQEMHAELVRLQERLLKESKLREWSVLRPHLARTNKPN